MCISRFRQNDSVDVDDFAVVADMTYRRKPIAGSSLDMRYLRDLKEEPFHLPSRICRSIGVKR
jgi:hypothetical protein